MTNQSPRTRRGKSKKEVVAPPGAGEEGVAVEAVVAAVVEAEAEDAEEGFR